MIYLSLVIRAKGWFRGIHLEMASLYLVLEDMVQAEITNVVSVDEAESELSPCTPQV